MPDLQYKGSAKHKRWRPGGGYGTLCPRWTRETSSGSFAGDTESHPWEETRLYERASND